MFRKLRRLWYFFSHRPRLSATLFTRSGCGLCDEARRLLEQHGYEVTQVNIDEDSDLKARFDLEIPVVEIAGKVRFRGRIDPLLLKRIRDQTT